VYGVSAVAEWSNLSGYSPGAARTRLRFNGDEQGGRKNCFQIQPIRNYVYPLAPINEGVFIVNGWWSYLTGMFLYQGKGMTDKELRTSLQKRGKRSKRIWRSTRAEITRLSPRHDGDQRCASGNLDYESNRRITENCYDPSTVSRSHRSVYPILGDWKNRIRQGCRVRHSEA